MASYPRPIPQVGVQPPPRSQRGHRTIVSVLVFVTVLVPTTSACRPQSNGSARHRNLSPLDLFRLHCSQCHGDGSGNGHRVSALKGKPKDLTTREWQESVTDQHLLLVIAKGGPAAKLHNDMPAWERQLSRKQIAGLVEYIRTLDDGQ